MASRLKNATSPYLLQHADNPVDWWPWSDEAFAAARDRDVPVLLSVGYSACHWCHVMAHESFEDPQTAALMNENLVAIKVDREERPDVDSVYMTATQAMTGQGGWPMTVFMTPDRDPFFCGTYFPREPFQRLVLGVAKAWREDRDNVISQAREISAALAERAAPPRGQVLDLAGDLPGAAEAVLAPDLRPGGRHPGGELRRGRRRIRRRAQVPAVDGARIPAAATPRARGSATASPPRRRWGWSPGPRRGWPAGACMTSSRGDSPGIRWTPAGWCRTSRRCSTTTPCWPGCTRTCGGAPGRNWAAGWPGRPAPGCSPSSGPPTAAWPRPWTRTATARKASSIPGRRTS